MNLKPKLTNTLRSTRILTLAASLSLAICSFSAAHASRAEAENNADKIAHVLETTEGYSVRNCGNSGFLEQGESTLIRTTLCAGKTYQIVAAGSEDAYDVDISIYDDDDNLIDKDTDTNPVAVAQVTPSRTGTFYIKVKMYDSAPEGANYCVRYLWKADEDR